MPWFAGIERSEIHWNPMIDHDKCVQCGICMNCGKQVFSWTENGPVVAQPEKCVVGCTTCRNLCQGNAIRFPPIKELRRLYEERKIWDAVREKLVEAGKVPPECKDAKQASAEPIPSSSQGNS